MDVQVQLYNPNYPPVSYQNVENSRMMYQMQSLHCKLILLFPVNCKESSQTTKKQTKLNLLHFNCGTH
jgi:hypothetical protein